MIRPAKLNVRMHVRIEAEWVYQMHEMIGKSYSSQEFVTDLKDNRYQYY